MIPRTPTPHSHSHTSPLALQILFKPKNSIKIPLLGSSLNPSRAVAVRVEFGFSIFERDSGGRCPADGLSRLGSLAFPCTLGSRRAWRNRPPIHGEYATHHSPGSIPTAFSPHRQSPIISGVDAHPLSLVSSSVAPSHLHPSETRVAAPLVSDDASLHSHPGYQTENPSSSTSPWVSGVDSFAYFQKFLLQSLQFQAPLESSPKAVLSGNVFNSADQLSLHDFGVHSDLPINPTFDIIAHFSPTGFSDIAHGPTLRSMGNNVPVGNNILLNSSSTMLTLSVAASFSFDNWPSQKAVVFPDDSVGGNISPVVSGAYSYSWPSKPVVVPSVVLTFENDVSDVSALTDATVCENVIPKPGAISASTPDFLASLFSTVVAAALTEAVPSLTTCSAWNGCYLALMTAATGSFILVLFSAFFSAFVSHTTAPFDSFMRALKLGSLFWLFGPLWWYFVIPLAPAKRGMPLSVFGFLLWLFGWSQWLFPFATVRAASLPWTGIFWPPRLPSAAFPPANSAWIAFLLLSSFISNLFGTACADFDDFIVDLFDSSVFWLPLCAAVYFSGMLLNLDSVYAAVAAVTVPGIMPFHPSFSFASAWIMFLRIFQFGN